MKVLIKKWVEPMPIQCRIQAGLCLLALLFLMGCTNNLNETNSAPNKPLNIVLLVGDDHGYADIGALGFESDLATPNLDRLVQEGSYFSQAYVTAPICNASRLGLISGNYQQRYGTYWYGGTGLDKVKTTIAEGLKTAGYTTGYVGKFHYGSGPTATPDNRSFPLNHGFDYFYGAGNGRKHYLIHSDVKEKAFRKAAKANKTGYYQSLEYGSMWLGKSKVSPKGFSTELFGKAARGFVRDNQNKPFFLQLSFNAVHNFTHQLPDEYLKKHNLTPLADWEPASGQSYLEWYKQGRYPNNPQGRKLYLGQLSYLDTEIGKLTAELEKLGLKENTVIIYISDNGGSTPIYASNGPLKGSKYTLQEGGVRIPMIVTMPKHLQKMNSIESVVSSLDIMPTLFELADVKAPFESDGKSLVSLLKGDVSTSAQKALYWDTDKEWAVREGKWKLHGIRDVKSANFEGFNLKRGEYLYNLDEDISESNNLITQYPDVVARLKAQHKLWKVEMEKSALK